MLSRENHSTYGIRETLKQQIATEKAYLFNTARSERSTRLNYLSRDEFKRSGSVEFRWRVNKYLTYFSVDDFVKPSAFKNDIGYKAILYSEERTFKTGYY